MGLHGVYFDSPFFTGSTPTRQVPHPYHCALAGHPYVMSLNPDANEAWGVRLDQVGVPLLRDQVDQSDQVGEQSLSPTGLWRRSMDSWHHGAGQTHYDSKTSDEFRFSFSLGINPWVQGQLSLLDGLSIIAQLGTFAANAVSVVAGGRWYVAAGSTLGYATSLIGGNTVVTGTITGSAVSADTDGLNAWVAYGSGGLMATSTATGAASAYFTGSPNITCVGYGKGRLLVGDSSGNLYNPTASGSALPTALVTTGAGTGWTWTDIADGPNAIYASGFRGDRSWVYAVTVNSAGTGLNVPFIAGNLPPGEIVRAIYSYAGFVILGTDMGARVCQPDASGNLTIGSLIPVGPVYGFTGGDRFVWFTWSNIVPGSGGTGRIDLSQELDNLTFAYASDLAYTDASSATTVVCRSVQTFLGATVFLYEKSGVTRMGIPQLNHPVPVGYLNTGSISYGIVDGKAAQFVDVRHDPLLVGNTALATSPAAVGVQLSTDSGLYQGLGYSAAAGTTGEGSPLNANAAHGETFTLKISLVAGGITLPSQVATLVPYGSPPLLGINGDIGTSPVLRRVTLRALEESVRITERIIPIQLRPEIGDGANVRRPLDFYAEREFLEGLFKSGRQFSYQEGSFSVQVTMYDMRWLAEKVMDRSTGNFGGTFVAHLRDVL